MANDAKLGLVLGVAVVLVIGLVFFRNDPAAAKLATPPAQQTSQGSQNRANPFYPPAQIDAARAR